MKQALSNTIRISSSSLLAAMAADIRKTQEQGVIRPPTIVLADPDGRKKASLIDVQAPQTFIKFFEQNLR